MKDIWKLLYSSVMEESGVEGGGGEPEKTEPENTEPEKTEPEKAEPEKTEPEKTEPEKTEPEKKPVNLMDDENEEQPKKEPTEEEKTAFLDAVKKIDIGEGVKWDDPALAAMAPSLMEITGGDSAKAETLVKAYTAYQQEQIRQMNERNDQFLNGLVDQCHKRFGNDIGKVCKMAKAGGLKIFGEKIWNVMKQERAFANNPDIIERLAMFGRTATDDSGVIKKEQPTPTVSGDWRENMYGGKK